MTTKTIVPTLAYSFALFSVALVACAQSYTPLAPLPIGEGGTTPQTYTLATYLSGMIKLLIAVGGGIAILMAIVGGTQYVAAGINPSAKSEAKDRIANSLIGLALILASYLILNTINPKLVDMNLLLPPIGGGPTGGAAGVTTTPGGPSVSGVTGGGAVSPGGAVAPGAQQADCPSCATLNAVVPQKAPGLGCAAPGPCQVSSSIAPKLEMLAAALKTKQINWQVTEMWPPTRTHKAACQNPGPQAGTCVDASILSERSAANIKEFVKAASINGLRAQYEVTSEQRRLELIAGGVPASNVSNLGSWITGEHFSVYNN